MVSHVVFNRIGICIFGLPSRLHGVRVSVVDEHASVKADEGVD